MHATSGASVSFVIVLLRADRGNGRQNGGHILRNYEMPQMFTEESVIGVIAWKTWETATLDAAFLKWLEIVRN